VIRQKIFKSLVGKLNPAFPEHELGEPNLSEVSE